MQSRQNQQDTQSRSMASVARSGHNFWSQQESHAVTSLAGQETVQRVGDEEEDMPAMGKFVSLEDNRTNQGYGIQSFTSNGFYQFKTNIIKDLGNASGGETSSKLIEKSSDGQNAWYRFKKDGDVIDSFSNNLFSGQGAGDNPVLVSVEIGQKADSEGKFGKEELGGKTRSVHFGLGDRDYGITKDFRKGKWTWHHQDDRYYMELVDMHVHGAFGHHGGYAGWQNDVDDDDEF